MVGGRAEQVVGNQALQADPERYFRVNFPAQFLAPHQVAANEIINAQLRQRLADLDSECPTCTKDETTH
jgi:hypothetical protein